MKYYTRCKYCGKKGVRTVKAHGYKTFVGGYESHRQCKYCHRIESSR